MNNTTRINTLAHSSPLFYGYPVSLIIEVLGVSRWTARRYKRGQLAPSEPARRLWLAYRERRLLPAGWLYNTRTDELVLLESELSIELKYLRGALILEHMEQSPTRARTSAWSA